MDSNATGKSNQSEVLEWDKKWVGRFFRCLQREVREKPADEAKVVLQDLLDTAHAKTIEQMLEYFFDDFMRLLDTGCFLVLQDKCQDHKFLCVLIRKLHAMCQGDCGEATLAYLQCSAQQWTAFAAIIVGLEEQDPFLVVSTLEKQLPQLQLMSSDHGECWLSWLRTLCLRLLQEDRVQVLRKILEYFLAHLSVKQLVRLSLLSEFLVATNRSQLFDPEDYNCLKEEQLTRFVSEENVELFLEALMTVSWESVPLILWIRCFKSEQVNSIPKELLIKLCLAVRALDNYDFREAAQHRVLFLFKDTIDGFSLGDYMVCIESLFIKGDPYCDHDRLGIKLYDCNDLNHIPCFNRRSFDIFLHNFCTLSNVVGWLLNSKILSMETLPKYMHGFWRIALCSNNQKILMDFYRKFYKVDTSLLQKGASLEEMQAHLLERLDCQTSEDTSFLKARCVDLFTSNLDSWRQLEELNLDLPKLMEQGTEVTISALVRLLEKHEKRIKDQKILSALIPRLRLFDDINNVLDYAYRNLTEKEYESFITNLMVQKRLDRLPDRKLSISLYLQLLLHGEPTTGLARIEADFAYNLFRVVELNAKIRYSAIRNLNKFGNIETKCKIFKELLKMNEKLSMEHPHYTENSEVHRQKLRIAFALIKIFEYCDDPPSLRTLLLPSDHLGINLMHEFLIGTCVESIDWVLKALPSLQPRQQESYLSIAYIFIFKNLVKLNEDKKLSEMFTSLLPLTMGSCYEVRTLAQIILHRLALECELNSIHIPVAESLISSVETLLGKKLYELQSEPRLILAEICMLSIWNNISDYILYMTNAPFDELYRLYEPIPHFVWNKIRNARQTFRSRKLVSSSQLATSHNLYKEVSFENSSSKLSYDPMGITIVVASLLDKETNFARLMLTCQRFGVDTLVLDEESHLEEYASGNIRISMVKSISLVEYLLNKRFEGYEIYACMETKDISRFAHYNFIKRGILVLGHKKNGIPANVDEILDNPVKMSKNYVFKTLVDEFMD